jgi:hypothetical protein
MNATGILKFGHFQPVSVKRVVRRDEEGKEQGYAQHWSTSSLPSRTLEAFVAYTPNRPTVQGDPANDGAPDRFPKVEEWVVGTEDEDIDTVCSLLVELADDWRVLWFIYEIVEGQIGQPSKMEKLGWATVEEIRLLRETANSRKAIGTAARHARAKEKTPAKPMTLREAKALVGRIVIAWLRWKHTGK